MTRFTAILTIIALTIIVSCTNQDPAITLRFATDLGLRQIHKQQSSQSWYVIEADTIKDKGGGIDQFISIENLISFSTDSIIETIDTTIAFRVVPSKSEDKKLDTVKIYNTTAYKIKPNGEFVDIWFCDERDSTNEAWLKEYYHQGWPRFPKQPIRVGHKWAHSTPVQLADEKIEATTNFELISLVNESGYDCALIKYKGNLVIPVSAKPDDPSREASVDRIEVSGVMYFAYKKGVVVLTRDHWSSEARRQSSCKDTGQPVNMTVIRDRDVEYRLTELQLPDNY